METKAEKRTRQTQNTRNYRKRHPERVRRLRAAQYWRRKTRALEMLGGAWCQKCGCTYLKYLEINHINGGGTTEIKAMGGSLVDTILSGKRNPAGLNVLCRVCNAADYLKRKCPDGGMFIITWERLGGQHNVKVPQPPR